MKVDKDKIRSALGVLENYLDGALADYEDNDVDNVDFIEGCIYTHKLLMTLVLDFPLLSMCEGKYEEQFRKIKEQKQG